MTLCTDPIVEIMHGKCKKAAKNEFPPQTTPTLHQRPHHRHRVPLQEHLEHVFCWDFQPPWRCYASPFYLLTPSQRSPWERVQHKPPQRRQRTQRLQRWHNIQNGGTAELRWGFQKAWRASQRHRAERSWQSCWSGWWCLRCMCCTRLPPGKGNWIESGW